MRLPDVNLLLYAVDEASPRHAAARAWLEDRLSGSETVAFAWSTLTAFLRLSTRASVFESPLSLDRAFDLVDGWLERPQVVVIEPTDRHAALLRELLQPLGSAGNLVTDAHLAVLAIEHGARLESADRDFQRFPGLLVSDPLGM